MLCFERGVLSSIRHSFYNIHWPSASANLEGSINIILYHQSLRCHNQYKCERLLHGKLEQIFKSKQPRNRSGRRLGSALLLALSCGTWFWLRTKRREKGGSPSAPMKHDTKSEREGNAAEEKMGLDVTTQEMSRIGKSLVSELNSKEERVPDIYVSELGENTRPVGYELDSGSMAGPNIDIPELGGNGKPVA
ncbi:hypothetical protein V8E51_000175 [Hyaloscypha variabilis]